MSDLDRPYDPDPLSIGDPVRVHISAECRALVHRGQSGRMNGRHGRVRAVWTAEEMPASAIGNVYHVAFEPPIEVAAGGGRILASSFARAELERLRGEDV